MHRSSLVVQAHVVTVVPAFVLGVWLLLFSRKGSRWHRALGAIFLALMVITALISLFIHRRMPESAVLGMQLYASVRPVCPVRYLACDRMVH